MNKPTATSENAPGHYGAGYGEQVPEDAPPAPLSRDADRPTGAGVAETTQPGGDDLPVAFTPEDVHLPPPDRTPTDAAPESEKAGLIFERS
ncbi:MAG: hypothetical protein ABIQ33_00180 [Caldimonas sp.]